MTSLATIAPSAVSRDGAASVATLLRSLRSGALDRMELLRDQLRRVEAARGLNAFLWADADAIISAAAAADVAGKPLAGLPIALKDNIDTAGIPTTSGSLVDRERIPTRDAAVWQRLRDRGGAVLLGKTHMSEFAYRSHHPGLGPVRNPRNVERATGGSSSGSAAAVAAGICAAAIGTDTGGSVRIPAAYCGVVGFKGTSGIVSNEGVVPLSTTMDNVGVLARSVTDAAIVFEQLTTESVQLVDGDTLRARPADPGRLRVGVERGWFASGAQPAVIRAWSRTVDSLASAGCSIVEVALPRAARWRAAHKTILLREAWQYHADRLRTDAPYGPVFRSAVSRGADITPARYELALALRRESRDTLAEVFGRVDVILTPTCPTVAPPADEGRRRLLYTRYTTLAAFAGIPAISVPAGTGSLGLPIGVQFMAAADAEPTLVAAAALLEDRLASATVTA